MESINGSTFIHFEESEDEWRCLFELCITAIVNLKNQKFDIDAYLYILKQSYERMEQMKKEINNLYF